LRQRDDESIAAFRERFEKEYDEAKAMGCNIGSQASRVFRFVFRLNDSKYGAYKERIISDRKLNGPTECKEFPKSLTQCVDAATAYSSGSDKSDPQAQFRAMYATMEKGPTSS